MWTVFCTKSRTSLWFEFLRKYYIPLERKFHWPTFCRRDYIDSVIFFKKCLLIPKMSRNRKKKIWSVKWSPPKNRKYNAKMNWNHQFFSVQWNFINFLRHICKNERNVVPFIHSFIWWSPEWKEDEKKWKLKKNMRRNNAKIRQILRRILLQMFRSRGRWNSCVLY